MTREFDCLVIGSGAAGLSLALKLAGSMQVAVISKAKLSAGSTAWAQGGIAAVLKAGDSIESHVNDTLDAGAGLCDPATVQFVVEAGPRAIRDLIGLGVPFTPHAPIDEDFPFHLTREGGHSHRRVIHVDDATGSAIQNTLETEARKNPNITVLENHMAIDLITGRHMERGTRDSGACYGAYILDIKANAISTMLAGATVLATGGASRVYLYSSNPDGSTGDGIAMAWRAGCRVANMEFNQFHPTCLYHRQAKSYLISEALRGEGAELLLGNGERFLDQFDPRAELAPRDIVARAIDNQMKRRGLMCVYLDISKKGEAFIKEHFPNIYARCLDFGFDLAKEPIPVVPAAHYTCGGVMTDLKGRSDLSRLYTIGEAAHTGLHGANRMASNSLLECLVFAEAAAKDILGSAAAHQLPGQARPWDESRVTDSDEEVVVTHNWAELRRFMWDYVGIVRTDKRLERAKRRLEMLMHEVHDYYGNFRVSKDLLELRNLLTAADLIVRSAIRRRESRGLHYTLDCPDLLPKAENTVLKPEPRT